MLVKDNTLEISLKKIKNPKLSELLKNAGLKAGGNKNELVTRMIDNIDKVKMYNEDLELPLIYTATEKGEQLLHETKYIPHFVNTTISLPRAHKIAETYLSSSSEDKTIDLYKFEIKRLFKLDSNDHELRRNFEHLASYYYYEHKNDNENARLYCHLAYTININNTLENLRTFPRFYYDFEDKFDYERLKRDISTENNFQIEQVYNQLIFIDELSNESIYDLFVNDIVSYYELDRDLSKKLVDFMVAVRTKENENLTFSKILDYINENNIIDKETVENFSRVKFDDEYIEDEENEDNFTFKTSLNKLIDKNLEVEIEVDINTGELFLFLEENDLKDLVEDELGN